MSTRKTTLFYTLLVAVASLAVGMVIASRLDLTPASSAQTMAIPPANSAPVTGTLDAQTFRNIAKATTPAVVNIRTEMRAKTQDLSDFFGGGGGGAPDDFFHRFFGAPGNPDDQSGGSTQRHRAPTTVAAGTGFVISAKDALILTNNHVVENAEKIEVSLYGEDDDQTYTAKLIGRDELTDSALIELVDRPSHPLPEVKFGDSSQMGPGDWVMAIGNPFGFTHTVTVGVISATKRPFQVTDGRTNDMLQTDAAINPGNSGGPLLNLRGEVIGINTAIISNSRTEGNIGIGFAVPINTVRELLPQLRTGKVVRGKIGVAVAVVPREGYQDFGLSSRKGALVATVSPGGAAAKAGIEPGDVIVEYNGHPVPSREDLVNMVVATKPGTTVPVRVLRNKQEKTLNVTVEELDLAAEEQAQRGSGGGAPEEQQEQGSGGFGLTLGNVTPGVARQLNLPANQTGALITDVDPNGPSAVLLRRGDVILSVNHKPVSSAAEAAAELKKIASGHIAQLLVWRGDQQVFVAVKKD
ncbi:MAG: Do family serine endopeptidase [Betaproteobacteria bacterium]